MISNRSTEGRASTALLATPSATPGEPATIHHVRATDLTSVRATIWTDRRVETFPVYLGFEGLAPYFIEGRIVSDLEPPDASAFGQVVEFTTLLHEDELIGG